MVALRIRRSLIACAALLLCSAAPAVAQGEESEAAAENSAAQEGEQEPNQQGAEPDSDPGSEHDQRLAEINRQVDEHTVQLKSATLRQEGLERELNEIKTSLRSTEDQQRSLGVRLEDLKREYDTVQSQIDADQGRVKGVDATALKRLRVIYMQGSAGSLESVLRASDTGSVVRHAYFFRRIRESDQKLVAALMRSIKEKSERSATLKRILAEQQVVRTKLGQKRQQLEEKRARRQALMRELALQRSHLQEQLAALRAQALRLETIVKSLTGDPRQARADSEEADSGSGRDAAGRLARADSAAVGAENRSGSSTARSVEPFNGPGLASARGRLGRPVDGKIVQYFGKVKSSGFKDLILSKGIEFAVAAGSAIRAVADGKVIFLGRMPGYGTMLIVDHGTRYYSLYGRLGETMVAPNDLVHPGDQLAVADAPDERSGNFYFEIRKEGAPVNPLPFLKKR